MTDEQLNSMSSDELAALNKQLSAAEAESKATRDKIAVIVHKRCHLQQAVEHLNKLTPEQKSALQSALKPE